MAVLSRRTMVLPGASIELEKADLRGRIWLAQVASLAGRWRAGVATDVYQVNIV
ncbi:hypothetical protein [Nonomuraea sp. CA-141351]|uniref:hypothetical protein n=1 Tax=Nonomuraea sp. CA-141351 TaxID=3239996 RepID=UPI003D9060CB